VGDGVRVGVGGAGVGGRGVGFDVEVASAVVTTGGVDVGERGVADGAVGLGGRGVPVGVANHFNTFGPKATARQPQPRHSTNSATITTPTATIQSQMGRLLSAGGVGGGV